MKKGPLGKGLQSLIPAKKSKLAEFKTQFRITHPKKETVFYIETRKVKPNPDQPRKTIDQGELQELAQSIREHGILQPLVVTKRERETPRGVDVEYVLIAGERRLEAAKIAKLREIPVIIRQISGKERLELSLVENIQRADLNAIERARAFKRLEEEFELTRTNIGERIGKSREAVANTLRLLELPAAIQKAVESRKISEGHARALLGANAGQRDSIFQEMLKRPMSVRESEFLVRTHREREKPRAVFVGWERWEKRFARYLKRSVRIRARKGGGEVVIPFSDESELNALHELFSSFLE